ncbi:tRNA1(Val) (adenine(37)-N6)-methyltransferase [Pseudoroseomonas cervicalis]|uniref:tRNA1(Val) (adenine(37)-N6)-methyltransferase n=1 Tax=Teichococcus cervicalis TaxID=204525 RepID=UPI00277EC72A|nr:methyltransferase domain-containing protein [Pseudoroseomonas cervicalis]MDQ1079022.1 tRNA1(Val) A37 N6-methylase TrmN6 [Pseudoroseomonas cervicalis]
MSLAQPDACSEDRLLGGRVALRQPRQGLRAGLDAVMLAAAIPARPGETVLEGGCGSGAVFLCLLARLPGLRVIAVERDPELAALARENAARNGHAAAVEVLTGDIADPALRRAWPRCDHAFANPPYWPEGSAPPVPLRAGATHAGEGPGLEAWAAALAAPLRHRGSLTLVLPTARFSEGAAALRDVGCGEVSLFPLWPRAGRESRRALLRGRRGGRGPDGIAPGMVLHDGQGWSAAAEAVLGGGEALPWR